MNFKPIEDFITQFPIYQYAFIKTEDVEFNNSFNIYAQNEH